MNSYIKKVQSFDRLLWSLVCIITYHFSTNKHKFKAQFCAAHHKAEGGRSFLGLKMYFEALDEYRFSHIWLYFLFEDCQKFLYENLVFSNYCRVQWLKIVFPCIILVWNWLSHLSETITVSRLYIKFPPSSAQFLWLNIVISS